MAARRPVTTVLFDLDDTLYPEREFVVSGFQAVAAFLGNLWNEDEGALLRFMLNWHDNHGRGQVFNALLAEHNVEPRNWVSALVHLYRTQIPSITLYPDVMPTIGKLRMAGVNIGFVTDGKASVQMRKLDTLGLSCHADVIVCTDDLPGEVAKPSVVPFEVAIKLLGDASDSAVYVGDDLAKDFLGPRQLGMRTIRVDRQWAHPLQTRCDFPSGHHADVTVVDLTEAWQWLTDKEAQHE